MKMNEMNELVEEFGKTLNAHGVAANKLVVADGIKGNPMLSMELFILQLCMTAYQNAAWKLFAELEKRTDETVDAAVNMEAKKQGFKPEVVK